MDGSKLSWMAWDFAAHLIAPRGEQLKVVHVTAPTQKQSLVPAQLRPEKLQADVEHRNYEHRWASPHSAVQPATAATAAAVYRQGRPVRGANVRAD
eukprot:COSAG01_NODE_12553_length_1721_cov_0.863132_2_plen_95_part_01